jgi:hypothetical protein
MEVTEITDLPEIRRVAVRVMNIDATARTELIYYVRNRDEDEL